MCMPKPLILEKSVIFEIKWRNATGFFREPKILKKIIHDITVYILYLIESIYIPNSRHDKSSI